MLYPQFNKRHFSRVWSEFVTNDEIRSRTGQTFLSDTVRSRRLSFFGHLHRADHDHSRAINKPALWVLLMIGDGGLAVQTILAENSGG